MSDASLRKQEVFDRVYEPGYGLELVTDSMFRRSQYRVEHAKIVFFGGVEIGGECYAAPRKTNPVTEFACPGCVEHIASVVAPSAKGAFVHDPFEANIRVRRVPCHFMPIWCKVEAFVEV